MHKKHHPRPVVPVHKQLAPYAAAAKQPHAGQQQKGKQQQQQTGKQQQQQTSKKQRQEKQQQQGKQQQQQQQQGKQQHRGPAAGSGPPAHKKQKLQHQQHNHSQQHHDTPANGHVQQKQQPAQRQPKQQEHLTHNGPKQPKQPRQQQQQQPKQELQQNPPGQLQQQQQQHQKASSKKRKRHSSADAPAPATGGAGATNAGAVPAASNGPVPQPAAAAAKPWHPGSATAVSSNWQALQQQLKAAKEAAAAAAAGVDGRKPFRRRRKDTDSTGADGSSSGGSKAGAGKRQIGSVGRNMSLTPVVAMDCEMVGVGPNGDRDSLARVSIVNAAGNVLLDTFVSQKEAVTDFRTWVSGVTPQHLLGAPGIEEVQKQVCELLAGRVVVGHSLNKDLKVLLLSHPRKDIRDTAKYPPFMFSKGGKRRPKALKQLAASELGLAIQEGQHSSVDDARAALYLYQKHAAEWERALKTPGGLKHLPTSNQAARSSKKRIASYGSKALADDPMADL